MRQLAASGELPCIRTENGRMFFSDEDVDALARRRAQAKQGRP